MKNNLLPGHYPSNYLVRQCGVPDVIPKWSASRKDFLDVDSFWTLGDDSLYLKSSLYQQSPWGYKDYALSLETGEVVWHRDVSDNDCGGVCLVDDYVCIGRYVHHVSDGRISFDLHDLIGKELTEFQHFIPFRDGMICSVGEDEDRGIVYVDLKKGTIDDFSIDLKLFCTTDDQGYVLGWSGDKICCFDPKKKDIVWTYDVTTYSKLNREAYIMAGFLVHDDKVYLYEKIKDFKTIYRRCRQ